MNKNKFSSLVIVVALLAGNALFAQSVDQGKKFYYYKRYKSAREQFEKVLASNPKNDDAIYWLGQTLIDAKDTTDARALFQKALAANPNAPLVVVGTGHVELMDGKTNEARQHFETAISLSKGKNIDVLNAIGKANAQTKGGDARYAIEKLNQATKLKNYNNNLNTYLYTGDAYRQLADGGGAVKAYSTAFALDSTLAEAEYKIGMIYRTQNNADTYLPAFEKAIEADPAYAPALYELYYHWYNRDINKAAEYFDKYFANSDHTTSDEYDQISIIYARRKYQEAIDAAKQKIAANPNAEPRYYRLIAYAYDELKDSVNAKNFLDQYYAKQKPGDFIPKDYVFRAQLLAKFPGNEDDASLYFDKAIAADTLKANQIEYATTAATVMAKARKYQKQISWLSRAHALKGEKLSEGEYFSFSKAVSDALTASRDSVEIKQLYATGDSITNQYIINFPDKPQGYSFRVLIAKRTDKDTSQGLALEPIERQNAFLQKDLTDANKKTLYANYTYLVLYYISYVKDMPRAEGYKKAIEIADKMLFLFPDTASEANQFATQIKTKLKNALDKSQKPSSQATRSAASGSGGVRK